MYNSATVPLLSEIVKLAISGGLLYNSVKKDRANTHMTTNWRSIMLFPIPSAIYVLHNNVQFWTLNYVEPATYQIMGNLKIITTGVLFRIMLGRHLTPVQWIALVLLALGAATSQIKNNCEAGGAALAAPVMGYLLGLLSACLSALAGVYTEFLLKKVRE